MKVLRSALYVLALPTVLFITWWVFSAYSTNVYFPSLRRILGVFPATWFEGGWNSRIVVDGFSSVWRLAVGFSLATLLALTLGTLIGLSSRARAYCEPTLELFRAIPAPVLVPVISLFAGIGDEMKIFVIMLGCLWPILLNTVEGVRAVDTVMIETAKSYHLKTFRRIQKLILPAASPQIIAGMRQGLSVGIILMVISEMFAATSGLGFTVVQFQRNFALPEMWTGIIVLGMLGLVASLLFQVFENRTLRWYNGMRQASRDS